MEFDMWKDYFGSGFSQLQATTSRGLEEKARPQSEQRTGAWNTEHAPSWKPPVWEEIPQGTPMTPASGPTAANPHSRASEARKRAMRTLWHQANSSGISYSSIWGPESQELASQPAFKIKARINDVAPVYSAWSDGKDAAPAPDGRTGNYTEGINVRCSEHHRRRPLPRIPTQGSLSDVTKSKWGLIGEERAALRSLKSEAGHRVIPPIPFCELQGPRGLLPGAHAQVGFSNFAPGQLRPSGGQVRARLHSFLSQVDYFDTSLKPSYGPKDQKGNFQHPPRTEVGISHPQPQSTKLPKGKKDVKMPWWLTQYWAYLLQAALVQVGLCDSAKGQTWGSVGQERDGLHRIRSVDGYLDNPPKRSCVAEGQKRDSLHSARTEVGTSGPQPQHATLPRRHEEVAHTYSPWSDGKAATTELHRGTGFGKTNAKCLNHFRLGACGQMDLCDIPQGHTWGSVGQERDGLCKISYEVGSFNIPPMCPCAPESQKLDFQHSPMTEVGTSTPQSQHATLPQPQEDVSPTYSIWPNGKRKDATTELQGRTGVGKHSSECLNLLSKNHKISLLPGACVEVGLCGFPPGHTWGSAGQERDGLRSLRPEVGCMDIPPKRFYGPEGQMKYSARLEVGGSDPQTQSIMLPQCHEEVLRHISSTERGSSNATPSHPVRQKEATTLTCKAASPQASETLALSCAFCKHNNESRQVYSSHCLKDPHGRVQCPVLRSHVCPQCQATGDNAHTRAFCPLTKKSYTSVYQSSTRKKAESPTWGERKGR